MSNPNIGSYPDTQPDVIPLRNRMDYIDRLCNHLIPLRSPSYRPVAQLDRRNRLMSYCIERHSVYLSHQIMETELIKYEVKYLHELYGSVVKVVACFNARRAPSFE